MDKQRRERLADMLDEKTARDVVAVKSGDARRAEQAWAPGPADTLALRVYPTLKEYERLLRERGWRAFIEDGLKLKVPTIVQTHEGKEPSIRFDLDEQGQGVRIVHQHCSSNRDPWVALADLNQGVVEEYVERFLGLLCASR